MKKYILKSVFALAALLSVASCEMEDFNEKYFGDEGYVRDPEITDVQVIDLTLSSDDYSTIASLSANVALAEAAGFSSELAAVGSNGCFSDNISAMEYVPAYLESLYGAYLSLGSKVKVTYNEAVDTPIQLSGMMAAGSYTVTTADYTTAWGNDSTPYFTPSVSASSKLPTILAEAYPFAEPGDYLLVSYSYSSSEPSSDDSAGDDQEVVYDEISEAANPDNEGQTYSVKGTVVVATTRSFLLKDETGYVLAYNGSDPGVAIGDVVTLTGVTSSYGGFGQFSSSNALFEYNVVESGSYTHPEPIVMSATDLDAYLTAPSIQYVKYTGTISYGTYINVVVDGTETAIGSVSYADAELSAAIEALDGQEVDVYGYASGVSSSKYVTTYGTYVVAAGSPLSAPMAKAAAVTSTVNVVYQFSGTKWAEADAVMLNSEDYTAMGSTYGNLSGDQPETYLPTYLSVNYPYAVEEDYVDVVYKFYDGSTYYKASRFILTSGTWTMYNDMEVVTGAPFELKESGWIFDPSMTISIGTTDSDNVALYFSTMVAYVKANYGSEYIDSYGTSEFYSGSASYYGNINWRYSYVLGYWAAAGIDITPYYTHTNGTDGLVAMYDILKVNLAETFAYALSVHNADAAPVDGMEVLYTVKFGLYHGPSISGTNAQMVFEVTGPGEFEFREFSADSAADVYSETNLAYVVSTYGSYYE